MMTHENHGTPGGAVVHHEVTPVTSTVVDVAVCERAPTGRAPLNYLPRQASRSMRVPQRRAAIS
jgi:hypothetical protein